MSASASGGSEFITFDQAVERDALHRAEPIFKRLAHFQTGRLKPASTTMAPAKAGPYGDWAS